MITRIFQNKRDNAAILVFGFILVVFFLGIMFAGGCGRGDVADTDKTKSDAHGVYRIGDVDGDWGYPTPFTAYPRGPGYTRVSYIFDTLVWKDEDEFVPALAEEWEYDEDSFTYIFELREGIKWHDGEELTASDVIFTFEYLQEKGFNWADLSVIEEVSKSGKNEVEITLGQPMGAFMDSIAGVVTILPEHVWQGVENPGEFSEPEAVIGSGPYKLEEYDRDKGSYRFSSNDDYYLGEPEYEELHFIKVSEPQMAVQRGDVNFARVEPEAVSQLEEQELEVISGSHDWNLKLMFNHREEPFNKVGFRRALGYFIDNEQIIERALRGHGLEGSPGMISPDSRWHSEKLPDYNYDPDKGKDKLESLGYEKEEGIFRDEGGDKLELEVYTRGDYSREGELVGEFLNEAGIKTSVRSFESSVLDDRIKNWDFELAINGHGGVGSDPEGISRFMVGEISPHINIQYDDPGLVDKLQAQSKEVEESKRKELIEKVQKIYADELPAYTIYYPTWYYAHDGEVKWFFTKDGLAHGIPLPLNKLALIDLE